MSKVIYIKKVFKDTKENLEADTRAYERGLMFYCKDDGSIKVADGERAYADLPYLIKSSGGGTGNYEELDNLPKINGITLKGNKTASDLGINIPTKLSDLIDDEGFITIDELEESQEQQNQAISQEIDEKTQDLMDNVYTKDEVYPKTEVYTKTEVDQKYGMTYEDLDNGDSGFIG